jgi:translocation and assembly module TamB
MAYARERKNIKKSREWIIAFPFLVFLSLLFFLLYLFARDVVFVFNNLQRTVSNIATESWGQDIEIGKIKIELLKGRIILSDISVKGTMPNLPPLAKMDKMTISIKPLTLLKEKDFSRSIKDVRINNLTFSLFCDEKGRWNIRPPKPTKPPKGIPPSFPIYIQNLQGKLTDLSLTKREWELRGKGEISLLKGATAFRFGGTINEAPFLITGRNSPQGFEARFSLKSLAFSIPYGKGILSANLFFRRSGENLSWETQASLQNASIQHKGLPFKVLNCSLNFAGNQDICEIKDLRAQTDNGLKLRMERVLISLNKPNQFEIKGSLEGKTLALLDLLRRTFKVRGFARLGDFPLKGEIYASGDLSNPLIEAEIHFPHIRYKGLSFDDNKLSIVYLKDKLEVEKGEGRVGGGEFSYKGFIDIKSSEYMFEGEIGNFEIAKLPSNLKNEAIKRFKLADFPQGVIKNLSLYSKGKLGGEPSIEGIAEISLLKYVKFFEENLYINFSYDRGVVKVAKLLGEDEKGKFAFKGEIDIKNGDIEGEMEGMDIEISKIANLLEADGLKGIAYLRGRIKGPIANPAFTGGVEAFNVGMGRYDSDYLFFEFKGDGEKLQFPRLFFVKGLGEGWAEGEINLKEKMVNLKGRAEKFVLSQLVKEEALKGGLGEGDFEIKGSLTSPQIVLNFKARDLLVENTYAKFVQGEVSWQNGETAIKNGKLSLEDGEVDFEGRLAGEEILLSLDGKHLSLSHLPLREEVRGFFDFQGKLAGTLRNPYFEGEVKAEPIYEDEVGKLKTSLFVSKERLEARDLTYAVEGGTVSASLLYLFKDKTLSGYIEGENIPLPLAERLTRLERIPSLQGKLSTNVKISGSVDNPSIAGIFRCEGIGNRYFSLSTLEGNYSLGRNLLIVENLKGMEKEMSVNGKGRVDLKKMDFSMEIETSKLPLSTISHFLPSITPAGEGNLTIKGEGSVKAPFIIASFNSPKMEINGEILNNLSLEAELGKGSLGIKKFSFFVDEKEVKGEAQIPWDIQEGIRHDSPLKASVSWEKQKISFLRRFLPYFKEFDGETTGEIHLEGTYNNPEASGFLNLEDGYMKPKGFEEGLKNVNVRLNLQGNKAVFEKATFQMGEGEGELKGAILIGRGGFQLEASADLRDLTLRENDISGYGEKFEGSLKGVVNLIGGIKNPLIMGRLILANSKMDFSTYTTPQGQGGGGRYFFNPSFLLDVSIGSNSWFISSGSRVLTEGRLGLTGTLRNPILQGHFSSRSGLLLFSNYVFRLREGTADLFYGFNTLRLNVLARAETMISGYKITANIAGPYEDLRVNFTSSPPLPQRAIMAMFVPSEFASAPEKFLKKELTNAFAVGVETRLLAPLEFSLAEAMGLEEISLEYSLEGFPVLRVRQAILPDTYIAYSRWLTTPKERYIVSIERRLKGEVYLTFSTDELKRKIWGIEGSLRF